MPDTRVKGGASINCHSELFEESLFAIEVNTEMFRFAQHAYDILDDENKVVKTGISRDSSLRFNRFSRMV